MSDAEYWTRVELPEGVYADVSISRAGGYRHSVCLYGPSSDAILKALREWAAHPIIEYTPPQGTMT